MLLSDRMSCKCCELLIDKVVQLLGGEETHYSIDTLIWLPPLYQSLALRLVYSQQRFSLLVSYQHLWVSQTL